MFLALLALFPLALSLVSAIPVYRENGRSASDQSAAEGMLPQHKRQELLFTQTVLVTVLHTDTATLTETLTSTMSSSPSPTLVVGVASGVDDMQSVLFLPPTQVATESTAPSSTSMSEGSDSEATPAPTSGSPNAQRALPLRGPIVAAYYPDWASDTVAPENVDFSRFNWIDFAFALPDENYNLSWDNPDSSPALLSRLVTAAHAHGAKVKLSIGGWTGSRYFSSACATDKSRRTFVSNIVASYKQYHLDGIDVDWEYPGQQGEGNNVVSPQDSANFLAFLRLLRKSLPWNARITAAATTSPFMGADGQAMRDVSAFGAVLDYLLIMNYDVWGSSANPGPNAPLDNGCNNSTQPGANAAAAVRSWTGAGFPPSKLVLGVPAYGYVNPSQATSLRQRRSVALARPQRRADLGQVVTVRNSDGGTTGGQVQFAGLVRQGALIRADPGQGPDRSNTGAYVRTEFVGDSGFTRFWDRCSSTPFLTSPYVDQVITYDDPESLQMKGAFAKQAGLLGVSMFDLTGDTLEWELTNALRSGLGLIQ